MTLSLYQQTIRVRVDVALQQFKVEENICFNEWSSSSAGIFNDLLIHVIRQQLLMAQAAGLWW